MTTLHALRWLFLLFALGTYSAQSQHKTKWPLSCGAVELTPAQRRLLEREAKSALSLKQSANRAPSALTYVPIKPHLFRTAAGTGGMSLAKLNLVMGITNKYYLLNGFGIQFYFCGTTPGYVDNNAHATSFNPDNEEQVAAPRDAANAMNMYFVNGFTEAGLGGYAYYPANARYSTRSFILDEADINDLANRLLPHEIGHNFNLIHTFEGSNRAGAELVMRGVGANCASAGDLVCDTPADPYGRPGASVAYVNGCVQYTGNATDPQGQPYTPSMSNIMSYYFPCTHDFSEGQYDRIMAGLALRQTHTAYSLDCAPTAVTAPANLSATLAGNVRTVVLTWEDPATNEMGYFVERSTRPTDGFGAVGGVGPGDTNFTDQLPGQGTYYYRIRPSNTTTGSLSPTIILTTPVCRPTYTVSCTAGNGLAGITVNATPLSAASGCDPTGYSSLTATAAVVGAGQSITVTLGLLNATTALHKAVWLDLDRDGNFSSAERVAVSGAATTAGASFTITLPTSLTAGTLPMRVITASTLPVDPCGGYPVGEAEDYRLMVQVAPGCTVPTGLTVAGVTGNSAQLQWTAAGAATFALQHRPTLTPAVAWTTLSGIISTSATVSGLRANTSYDWQVLTTCGPAGSSTLSAPAQFTTACPVPTGLTATQVAGNTAQLNWSGTGGGTSFLVQLRPQSQVDWTTLPGTSVPQLTLTGLTLNTPYTWRVATVCGVSITTPYSASASFTTNSQLVYCRPASQYGCSDNDGLDSFVLSTSVLSANSGCSSTGYQSFTALGGTVLPGQPYSFTATLLNSSFLEGLTLWLDLNRNGTLEPAELLYQTLTLQSGSISGSFTIPANATPGLLTMRVRVEYNQTLTNPCAAGVWGEVEDYRLLVGPLCPPPVALATTRLSATTATVSWQGPATASYGLRWRVTGGTATWTELALPASLTATDLTGLSGATPYEWQVRMVCGGTPSPWSTSGTFVTLPQADLSLAMQADTRTPALNGPVRYLLTLRNDGPNPATQVRIESLLPPNMVFAGSSQSAVAGGPSVVSVVVPVLAPFTAATFSFSAQPTAPGTFRVAAQVVAASAEDPDSFVGSGTADGEDDASQVDLRTPDIGGVFDSPNPNQRPLPPVVGNQPPPNPAEADLSLQLRPDTRSPLSGAELSLLVMVSNRGGQAATAVQVAITLPDGWLAVTSEGAPGGLVVAGQVVTVPLTLVPANQTASVVLRLQTGGTGEQRIRGVITSAGQPDLDSVHTNAYGQGEDDEAETSVRVR